MSKPDTMPSKDLCSGIMFVALGAAGLFLLAPLDHGSASRMGAGYFPTLICFALLAIGAAVGLRGISRTAARVQGMQLRPLLVVMAAILSFGLTVRPLGLAVALPLLLFVGALAIPRERWLEVALLAIAMTAFVALVFVVGLGLPIKVLPR